MNMKKQTVTKQPITIKEVSVRTHREMKIFAVKHQLTMGQLLESIDEVHCLTSLAGFEALLRSKKVTCYGHPFYAGWGLTNDVFQMPRRNKMLMLDELVAGALILYPHYMSRTKESLISPEEALDELIEWQQTSKKYLPWWRKIFRMLLRIIVGVR